MIENVNTGNAMNKVWNKLYREPRVLRALGDFATTTGVMPRNIPAIEACDRAMNDELDGVSVLLPTTQEVARFGSNKEGAEFKLTEDPALRNARPTSPWSPRIEFRPDGEVYPIVRMGGENIVDSSSLVGTAVARIALIQSISPNGEFGSVRDVVERINIRTEHNNKLLPFWKDVATGLRAAKVSTDGLPTVMATPALSAKAAQYPYRLHSV